MRNLLLFIVICSCYGGSTWEAESEARAGESIVFQWEDDGEGVTGWKLFRQNGTGGESEIASGSADIRTLTTEMPTGTVGAKVRYVLRPMKGDDMGPAGAEIVVKRVK